MDITEFVSAAQAAAILEVTTGWVYELTMDGRLPCTHIGRALLIKRSDLETVKATLRAKGRK